MVCYSIFIYFRARMKKENLRAPKFFGKINGMCYFFLSFLARGGKTSQTPMARITLWNGCTPSIHSVA